MRVSFIAAECEPWAKTGGLGDVVDALARALGRTADSPLSRLVDVYLPRYRSVEVPEAAVAAAQTLRVPDPTAAAGVLDVGLIDIAADGYRLRLVDHPPAFDRDGFYGEGIVDFEDNAWRFGLLARVALEAIRRDGGTDVLHLHDWHACPAVLLRDGPYARVPDLGPATTVLTVHNLAYHGWIQSDRVWLLGLDRGPLDAPNGGWPNGLMADTGIDLLRAGIERVELVNTVSPTYAREALRPEFGMGLDLLLRQRGDRFIGILNGIDPEIWDPGFEDLAGKARARVALVDAVGFDQSDDGPILGAIGRLDPQKGFDLLAGAVPGLVQLGARVVVQGNGDPRIGEPLRALAASYPLKVAFIEAFDREMARRIYAGADVFAMPSRFEPSGQGQMIAMRSGTPPIVRRTGGLADSVRDVDADPAGGTGFFFDPPEVSALLEACRRAFRVRTEGGGGAWRTLVARDMAQDFSWEAGPAPAYLAAYRRALELVRATRARSAPAGGDGVVKAPV